MLEELDFRKEANNIKTFTDFLERAEITDAVAPKVLPMPEPLPR